MTLEERAREIIEYVSNAALSVEDGDEATHEFVVNHFRAAVAEEREACARVIEYVSNAALSVEDFVVNHFRAAVAEEREACARVADAYECPNAAAAIRGRA